MARFSANLSLMYPELAVLDRIAAAYADGFRAVEIQFPYEIPASIFANALRSHGLEQVLINAYPGDLQAGEFGLAALVGRQRDFVASVELAIDYALALNCPRIHVMAGIVRVGEDPASSRRIYVENLRWACERLASHDLELLIEPINAYDVPGYFLNSLTLAHEVLHEVGASNLRLLMDFYHLQRMQGQLAESFETYRQHVGHVQIAGVPGRNEPDAGEIHYPFLFELLDRHGYEGWIGCEYRPARAGQGGTSAGLNWFNPYRAAPGT